MFISVPNTFSNGTAADATAVNNNFAAIINGLSDGTKSLSIDALTVAGLFNINNIAAFPIVAGVKGQLLQNGGTNDLTWSYGAGNFTTITSADATITTIDGFRVVSFSTSNTDRTCTLPAAASSARRTGTVTITRAGADTIDGLTSILITSQYDYLDLYCDGTTWQVLGMRDTYAYSDTISNIFASAPTITGRIWRNHPSVVNFIFTDVGTWATAAAKTNTSTPALTSGFPARYRPAASKYLSVATAANGDSLVCRATFSLAGIISFTLHAPAAAWTTGNTSGVGFLGQSLSWTI